MKKNLKVKIHGSVQGVGFRFWAQDKANEFGVRGFARNESDGSVYVEVEGEGEGVEKFLEWCRTGPPSASVKKVDFESSSKIRNYRDFTIE